MVVPVVPATVVQDMVGVGALLFIYNFANITLGGPGGNYGGGYGNGYGGGPRNGNGRGGY
jgi:hypothetical protein